MNSARPWQIWLLAAACIAVLLGAVGWISLNVLRLEASERGAREHAAREETARLALWRMESALAPLVSRESARPYFAYNSFYPAEGVYTRMFAELRVGEVLVPSPLLTETFPHVLLHFQFAPDGLLTSPQVPSGNMRDLAESGFVAPEQIESFRARLAKLADLVAATQLLAALPAAESHAPAPAIWTPPVEMVQKGETMQQQRALNTQELQARQRAVLGNLAPPSRAQRGGRQSEQQYPQLQSGNEPLAPGYNEFDRKSATQLEQPLDADFPANVSEGASRPIWIGQTLLLARRVQVNGAEYVQGCWLDWPALRSWLLEDLRDLLPEATLEPAAASPDRDDSRRLAALPVRLVAGTPGLPAASYLSPTRMTLLVAWLAVALAVLAVVALLSGAVSLSERRAAFVSAVTHELRTPLTTFRLYTDLLAEGLIKTEEKRGQYLDTLRTESDRLNHLVENVLGYARLERGRTGGCLVAQPLVDLLARFRDRLTDRAAQAGLRLDVRMPADPAVLIVRADAGAVEQILFNLVDNAAKYAADRTERSILLDVTAAGTHAALRVRDHGPGISALDSRRLFRPFSKSARDAASSAPGVGLGLALSRRLARAMHGDLRHDPSVHDGACFVLTLPLAERSAGESAARS